jgi:hypothetical protein
MNGFLEVLQKSLSNFQDGFFLQTFPNDQFIDASAELMKILGWMTLLRSPPERCGRGFVWRQFVKQRINSPLLTSGSPSPLRDLTVNRKGLSSA